MENNDNQGSYQQSEQQWICPNCETVNSGECCAVCGFPSPKKQEDKAQKTADEQGSYEETAQEWICPNCETHNTRATCTVCGCPHPKSKEKKKRISKKSVIAAVAAAVIVISTLVSIAAWLPYHRYQNACSLLESGQYEQAYQAFSAIEDYRNSNFLGTQAILKWATELDESGDYVKALEVLELLPDDVSVISLTQDIRYNYALFLLKRENNYKEAYLQFTELGDYKNSSNYTDRTVSEWYERILNSSDEEQANIFKETVTLTSEQSDGLYQSLYTTEFYTYLPDGGWSFHEKNFRVRGILLDMLHVGSYSHKAELKTLFSEFDGNLPAVFIREHRDILEKLWDMPVVQNIVRNDLCIDEWLLGTWRTENGSHYFNLTQEDSGGYRTSYNIPWVAKPKGTTYYEIRNLTYVHLDEDNNALAEVYRFKLLEPDRIEIYAYKNEKTYTLVRK